MSYRLRPETEMDLQQQLESIYELLQGTFDSNKQYQVEKELQERDGKEPVHPWSWSSLYPVQIAKIGPRVLMARQGLRCSGKIYRQRLYSLQINHENCCVENQIYKLKDESLFEKAVKDCTVLEHLSLDDVECVEGCNVSWEYVMAEDRYHGTTKDTCRFQSTHFSGKTVIALSDIYLSKDELWTRDRIVDLDGNKLYGFKYDEHVKLLRCKTYSGTIAYRDQKHQLSLHNQGGEVKLDSGYGIKLAQIFNERLDCDVLQLTVFQNEEVIGKIEVDSNTKIISEKFGEVEISLMINN